MADYKDLREFLDEVRRRGRLYSFTEPVSKETDLLPLFRVQMRGFEDGDRRVLLFEDVRGADGHRYNMQVAAGVYGASKDFVIWGLGCQDIKEALERWHHGLMHPLEPVIVDSGPVHEEVHTGAELKELGLDELPIPVEEPGFSGMLRTGTPMFTKDPETGVRNVGTYNGFLRARDRMVAAIGAVHDAMVHHWTKARQRKEPLPLAIVVGATPVIMTVGSARIPYGLDELAVAGGITGAPLELVRCKTIPLEVPATAEIVIEGLMSTEMAEPRTPFGEYPGYLNMEENYRPVFQVTAITHRKNAIFTPVTVGFFPSDTNTVWGFAHEAMLYHHLRYGAGFPVDDVHFLESAGAADFCIIRLQKRRGINPWSVLQATSGLTGSKFVVVVDDDINIRDPEGLLWAMTYRVRPEADMQMVYGRGPGLDPSGSPPGTGHGRMESNLVRYQYGKSLINATRKWDYPPVALPAKQYMEHALELWKRHEDLPQPKLKEPWHGYELGVWSEDDSHTAKLMTEGKYLEVGEKLAQRRQPITKKMVGED